MPDRTLHWQIHSTASPPPWFTDAIRQQMPDIDGRYIAQLLWQREMRDPAQLAGFLDAQFYHPTSPFAFGQEMEWAVDRLSQAYHSQEPIAIWGDFDADGVTATGVLWDGLGQFFTQQKTLFYYIPNRLTESHGLSRQGMDWLYAKGCRLIVTCDTGSTSLEEIEYARHLAMDVIVTDHHTLPPERPPVTAMINPRYLPGDHPLATLSGVAVAYKLVEALYERLPQVPQKPLEHLLDLVAIGLIADLVELKGDCRYLAQRGIEQLQKQSNPATVTRPGVAKLLEFCKRSGDRPTDISFGLGPRINAVSRIHGDAHFCVELLTSEDTQLCTHLAEATELANTRRKALQKEVTEQVTRRLAQLDLSTTGVIVLADEQWQVGILGLVAGQIAQEYGRPTILLSTEGMGGIEEGGERGEGRGERGEEEALPVRIQRLKSRVPLARGSARSVNNIDLYQLVKDQAHLLTTFGGHPYAAGLSLPVENLPLFTEGINQTLRQSVDPTDAIRRIQADLTVTVAELGKELFQELKLLEPCGMGNPVPRLLIQNCWFDRVWNKKIQDWKGQQVQYIKTEFELWDESATQGFAGVWWGHYRDELPAGRCDVIVELDSNNYKKRYEVRLVAVRPCADQIEAMADTAWIMDLRQAVPGEEQESEKGAAEPSYELNAFNASTLQVLRKISNVSQKLEWQRVDQPVSPLFLHQCPSSWSEFQVWLRRSRQEQRPLAIAYPSPSDRDPQEIWHQLVGVAKYLSRTGKTVTRQQVLDRLGIGDRALEMGFQTLGYLGFSFSDEENALRVTWQSPLDPKAQSNQGIEPPFMAAVQQFIAVVKEEQFRRRYFYQVPLATIQAVAAQLDLPEARDAAGNRDRSSQLTGMPDG
ncbi:DHH family phosphoesterase [Leptothermofonsia sichuanensis E412]|uniref:single-stranded-DNA-specific exonuclease RecJ n=1 Tax=Leptothermofonsia sichuanensis TaxID=2917832 RepID=UPI001CA73A0C|nr:DHH family phosphoesterase [Leptothermofonsia sichuanensis]QZZ21953.1 DHH family phosphoesterase [Leptothermofonsia sichuanensis E412]